MWQDLEQDLEGLGCSRFSRDGMSREGHRPRPRGGHAPGCGDMGEHGRAAQQDNLKCKAVRMLPRHAGL